MISAPKLSASVATGPPAASASSSARTRSLATCGRVLAYISDRPAAWRSRSSTATRSRSESPGRSARKLPDARRRRPAPPILQPVDAPAIEAGRVASCCWVAWPRSSRSTAPNVLARRTRSARSGSAWRRSRAGVSGIGGNGAPASGAHEPNRLGRQPIAWSVTRSAPPSRRCRPAAPHRHHEAPRPPHHPRAAPRPHGQRDWQAASPYQQRRTRRRATQQPRSPRQGVPPLPR